MTWQMRRGFWREAFALTGSVTPRCLPLVVAFGCLAGVICLGVWFLEDEYHFRVNVEVAPYEVAGAVLGLLLVLRTNAGYERWWEGRRLWGGIVNQCRNLAIDAHAYGPSDGGWRAQLIAWIAVFPHAARQSLRNERQPEPFERLLGEYDAGLLLAANHMPSYVALRQAQLLRRAVEDGTLSDFAFLQIDRERALLIDHVGACERILKTPLPMAHSIKIRQFLLLFLLTLPFALLHRLEAEWLVPFITMVAAYPLLALDQIGVELENPFVTSNLNHLPLDDISLAIEKNVTSLDVPTPPGQISA